MAIPATTETPAYTVLLRGEYGAESEPRFFRARLTCCQTNITGKTSDSAMTIRMIPRIFDPVPGAAMALRT